MVEVSTEDDLLEAPKAIRDAALFELKEIERRAKKLKSVIEAKRSERDGN